MNNKNKVYQLGGGHLHDENGGKASAWMTASYVSALAAFTQWQKHTGCQAFESISSSKHESFPKSCQWWWSQKGCEDTFDITLSSLILNECTFKPTMCSPKGHNMSIMMISQMWMLNSRRRSAARRTCLHSINSAKTELLLSSRFTILRQLTNFEFISKNDLSGKY